jgi:hypothetical protein
LDSGSGFLSDFFFGWDFFGFSASFFSPAKKVAASAVAPFVVTTRRSSAPARDQK